jgi:hypothetical protein
MLPVVAARPKGAAYIDSRRPAAVPKELSRREQMKMNLAAGILQRSGGVAAAGAVPKATVVAHR